MAFITITDNVNLINILDGNTGLNTTINKPFDVTVNPTEIYITIKSVLEIVQINFDDVLVPATANIFALRDLVASYNNTGGASGDATAANQVLEIAQLTAINGKLPAAASDTLVSSIEVASGSIAAGAQAFSALFSDDFIGTFNGVARTAGSMVTGEGVFGNPFLAIPFTIVAGSITIDKIL